MVRRALVNQARTQHFTEHLGIILYELHLPTAILANRAYAAREILAKELLSRLELAQSHLKAALALLLLEPADTPEGLLARRALQEMKLLGRSVEDARALAQSSRDEEDGPGRQQQRRGKARARAK